MTRRTEIRKSGSQVFRDSRRIAGRKHRWNGRHARTPVGTSACRPRRAARPRVGHADRALGRRGAGAAGALVSLAGECCRGQAHRAASTRPSCCTGAPTVAGPALGGCVPGQICAPGRRSGWSRADWPRLRRSTRPGCAGRQRLTSEVDVGPGPPLRARMESALRREPDPGAAVPPLSAVPDLPTALDSTAITGLPRRRCLTWARNSSGCAPELTRSAVRRRGFPRCFGVLPECSTGVRATAP